MSLKFWIISCSALLLSTCQQQASQDNTLASAYGNKLSISDISESLEGVNNKEDSMLVINRQVDNWLMDEILFEKAKNEIANKAEIEKLVEDYRKSIYIHKLEKQMLSEVDTTITKQELDNITQLYKNELGLNEPMVRFIYLKISPEVDNDTLDTMWKTEDIPGLKVYLNLMNGFSLINIDQWYYRSELKAILPPTLYKKINFEKVESYSLKNENEHHYLKIIENVEVTDPAPNSYLKRNIKKKILQERTNAFLKEYKKELYQNNIENKAIQLYTPI